MSVVQKRADIRSAGRCKRAIKFALKQSRNLRLFVCLIVAGVIAFGSPESNGTLTQPHHQEPQKSPTSGVASKPIGALRVGDRVWTNRAERAQDSETEVDPATWKCVVLRAESRWEDGTLDDVNIETLQPPEWIAAHKAKVGSLIPLPLDLVEMGLPETLQAKVLALEPCPPISTGPGRVVLTTVNHLNCDVCDLTVEDKNGQCETVRSTGYHRFCRESGDQWVHLNELRPGDLIRGRRGALTIVAISQVSVMHRVYNLTVEGDHVYQVSALGVLAHNMMCGPELRALAEANITNSGKTMLGHYPGYITKATAKGASYFNIGKAWDSLTQAERLAANSHFLDKIAAAGDQVLLSVPKGQIKAGSWLEWEIKYLESKGYKWINQWSLRK